jgi:maleate isomerase
MNTSTQKHPLRPLRVALLVPSSNTVMENDLHRALPKDQFTVHTGRMFLTETTREQEIRMIEDFAPKAASDLGTLEPDVLVFGCTSAGSLFGMEYDAQVCQKLGSLAQCEAIGVISTVAQALAQAHFKRVAIITPYNEDLTQSVAKAVEKDVTVVGAWGMGITHNVALADPTPEEIVAFAKSKLSGVVFDGLFVSCTNFRSYEAKEMLEQTFGVPVVTSNSSVVQALLQRVASPA